MRKLRWHFLLAALAGLGLRLLFVWHFPSGSGDTPLYEELASNWLQHGTYGLWVNGRLAAVDLRVPGYPAYLALLYALTGKTGAAARLWVMLAQALADLATCFLAAGVAAALAPRGRRARVAAAALWLATLCPFVANYAAVPLTEVFATFFVTLALAAFALSLASPSPMDAPLQGRIAAAPPERWACAGAFFTGVGALFRPETPLVLIAAVLFSIGKGGFRRQEKRLARTALLVATAFVLPLLPWATRNAVTLHKAQFLAPRYAQLPGEIVPRGFIAWENTWLVRLRDAYLVAWKLNVESLRLEDLPSSAIDSPAERERVEILFSWHNRSLTLAPDADEAFGELARERTARRPLRTFLWVPLGRAFTLWFTPRIELLPYSGHLWPVAENWREDPVDFSATVGLFVVGVFYAGLALLAFAWIERRGTQFPEGSRAAIRFLAFFFLVRTLFLTTIESPEPRYVVECFPALAALGALLWARNASAAAQPAADSGESRGY